MEYFTLYSQGAFSNKIKFFIADTATDIQKIDVVPLSPGCRVINADNSEWYTLNNDLIWVPKNTSLSPINPSTPDVRGAFLKIFEFNAYVNGIEFILADDETEKATIDTSKMLPGSRVFVAEDNKWYILNTSLVWKLLKTEQGGGSGADFPVGTEGQIIMYDENGDVYTTSPASAPAEGSTNVITAGAVYDALQDVGGEDELQANVTANTTVGAIANGTTISEGTTFTEFVQKLLISEIAPTWTFSISKSGNVAYGTSYNEVLTVAVSNMGTAKKISKIAWYEGSTLKREDTIDSTTTGSWTYSMPTATTNTTTFKAIITYQKSNDANGTSEKTSSITFYYNKFYGVVNSLTPSEATVEALTSALATGKGGTYSFTASATRPCYAYPKSLGALTSIKDGNNFSLMDSFTRTEQTYTQNGTSVVYYLYVFTDATTVSNYSITFA